MDDIETQNAELRTQKSAAKALVLIGCGFALLAFYFNFALKFNLLRSDVFDYWQDSLAWKTPFNLYHLPLYPLTIALVRAVTFEKLPPILIMMSINFAALLICAYAVYKILKNCGIEEGFALTGAYLFSLWPFIGLTYSVFPLADVPAMAIMLTGLLALLNSRLRIAALLLGLSLIFHKAMWLFVFFIITAELLKNKFRLLRDLPALMILVLPLVILWLLGAVHHNSIIWIFSKSISVGSESRKTFPIFQGIIQTIQEGGLKAVIKGGLIIILVLLSAVLLILNFRKKNENYQYGAAICISCLILFVFLTRLEIWAAVRFSRPLVLPLTWNLKNVHFRKSPVWLNGGLIMLLLTQFAFAWYMANVVFK